MSTEQNNGETSTLNKTMGKQEHWTKQWGNKYTEQNNGQTSTLNNTMTNCTLSNANTRSKINCWRMQMWNVYANSKIVRRTIIIVIIIITIIIYPLIARVVGAPQMISQPVSSISLCFPLPSGTWRIPGLSIPWCCLPNSSSVCLVFFPLSLCLARCLHQTWWTGDVSKPVQFASLYDGQEVFVWSDCLLGLGADFLAGIMVFVWDAEYLAVATHILGLYSSSQLCCEGPWLTSIQEDGCDKGARLTSITKPSHLYHKLTVLLSKHWSICVLLRLQAVRGHLPFVNDQFPSDILIAFSLSLDPSYLHVITTILWPNDGMSVIFICV